MNTLPKICQHCARGYSHLLETCPHCGKGEPVFSPGNPFLSGQYSGVSTTINLPAGTKLLDGRFTIKNFLGRGRWASVYLAHDSLRKMEVALKVVVLGTGSQEEALAVFQNELDLHTNISDLSHIIHLFDVNIVPWGGVSLLLLAMEYAEGGSLRDWLTRNQSNKEVRRREGLVFFVQACLGYQPIHSAGWVYLDTNPANFLFSNGVLKVSDLGAAYLLGRDGHGAAWLQGQGILELGTPIYMSPEQFQVGHPDDLDHRSDIYSLGVVLFEILSPGGRPPFAGSMERIRDCHLNVRPARIRDLEPHLQQCLDRCLAKDPDRRFQSVEELIEALEKKPAPASSPKMENERIPAPTPDDKYQRAATAYQREDLQLAVRLLTEILEQQPGHERARELLDDLRARHRLAEQLFTEATALLGDGSMATAMELVQEAMETYPDHPSTRIVLTRAKSASSRFADCMMAAESALQNGAWDNAASFLSEALRLNREVPNVGSVLNRVNQIRQAIADMHGALSRSEYSRAGQLAGLADALAEELRSSLPALSE